jgi:hypothetical protein
MSMSQDEQRRHTGNFDDDNRYLVKSLEEWKNIGVESEKATVLVLQEMATWKAANNEGTIL